MIVETTNGRECLHQPHVLIIGAGITGLVLAQALRKHRISFSIFERDPSVSFRGRGWGLTIHWSLDAFLSLLPQHLIDELPSVYVDPEASATGENGNFLFFDLHTGEVKWKVPPARRIRVSRERLRALLLDDLDVQVSLKTNVLIPGVVVSQSTYETLFMNSGPKTSFLFRLRDQKTLHWEQSQPTSPTLQMPLVRFSLGLMVFVPKCAQPSCRCPINLLQLARTTPFRSVFSAPASSILPL